MPESAGWPLIAAIRYGAQPISAMAPADHGDDREPQQWFDAAAGHGQHQGHDRQRERGVRQQQRVEQRGDAEEETDADDRGPTATSL